MSSKINFNFHESFPPQLTYISKILDLAIGGYKGTKFEISTITGIPTGDSSGKVVPHIKYAGFMNLINYEAVSGSFDLSVTDIGKIVYEEDPYLMDELTLEILHYYISHEKIGAPQWSFLFRSYVCEYSSNVKGQDIENKFFSIYGKKPEMGPLRSMYDSEDFSPLGVLEYNKKNNIYILNSKKANSLNQYLYAYTLLEDWERLYPNKFEITFPELVNELKWNRGFSLDYTETMEALDIIASLGFVRLNKQLEPITIIKNARSQEIKHLIYSNML